MRICNLKDLNYLSLILGEPGVFGPCSDGYSNVKDIKKRVKGLLTNPNVVVLSPCSGMVMVFVKMNAIMYELHIAFSAKCKESFTTRIKKARAATIWIIKNIGARKVVAFIPEFNRGARLFAVKCGLVPAGILTKSFLNNGRLHSLCIFENTEEDLKKVMEE